ncbi:MAG: iron dependent repressor, metal binding and dimerization domain protein [Ignavibacteria bacterium]
MLRRKKNSKINLTEDIIKLISKEEYSDNSGLIESISEKLGIPKNKIFTSLSRLKKMELIDQPNGKYELTEKGRKVAERLVRSHRLWETYIAEKNIVNIEDIHQEAEKFEHILSDDLLSEIDEELGHPLKDPHGSPIPKKH